MDHFLICVSCNTVLSVPCSLVVTCWERADLLALLYVMFSCVFVTFPYGVLGQVWYLIYGFLRPYFAMFTFMSIRGTNGLIYWDQRIRFLTFLIATAHSPLYV